MELPLLFQKNMEELLREEYPSFLESYQQPRVYGLRVNPLKLSSEEFQTISPFELTPVPWIEDGFYYREEEKPAKHPYYFGGLYYLQEPSAMTPANVLPVEPGDRILDLCAAPGGKSTALAAKLKGTGLLVSNDISNSRAKALLKNLELFGVWNAIIMSESPYKLAQRFPGYFDKILIDAPCSGEGMFRKEPATVKSWMEKGNDFYVRLQREITGYALTMLRPGGMMLYSTCTFCPQENEGIVMEMKRQCPELKVLPIPQYPGFAPGRPDTVAGGTEDLKNCVRIFPHKMQGEGHFLALLKKGEGERRTVQETDTGRDSLSAIPELCEFLKRIKLYFEPSRIEIRGEKVQYLPEPSCELSGLRVLRSGLLLGELKKNRFEPSQALAMALRECEFADTVSLSSEDERVIRYLKGETLQAAGLCGEAADGWQLICVDHFPLGFVKKSCEILKNKYLAGWRWQ